MALARFAAKNNMYKLYDTGWQRRSDSWHADLQSACQLSVVQHMIRLHLKATLLCFSGSTALITHRTRPSSLGTAI